MTANEITRAALQHYLESLHAALDTLHKLRIDPAATLARINAVCDVLDSLPVPK